MDPGSVRFTHRDFPKIDFSDPESIDDCAHIADALDSVLRDQKIEAVWAGSGDGRLVIKFHGGLQIFLEGKWEMEIGQGLVGIPA